MCSLDFKIVKGFVELIINTADCSPDSRNFNYLFKVMFLTEGGNYEKMGRSNAITGFYQ